MKEFRSNPMRGRGGLLRITALLLCTVYSVLFCGLAGGSTALAYQPPELNAEEPSVDPTGSSDGYSAVLYDNTSGLPTSEANAITETSEGFIWIGSYSGLIRYDGNSFERMDSTNGIASVVSLFADSNDRLWIGTNDSGLAVMENGSFTRFSKEDGLPSLSVRSLTEDDHGDIYAATTHGIFMIGSDMKVHKIDEPQINEEFIRVVKTGCDGVIYGVTMNSSVFTMQDGRLTGFYDSKSLGVDNAHTIVPDPDNAGYVYISDKESNLYYGRLTDTFKGVEPMSIAPLAYANSISVINGDPWVCTDNGIGFLQDGRLTELYNIPMNTSIEGMMMDYQGNLWFVSSQQGVMKIVPNQFMDIYEKYGLDDEVVYSTCVCDHKLFIGTKNSGLRALGSGRIIESIPVSSYRTASGTALDETDLMDILSSSKVRSIVRDSSNRLWFSTFGDTALIRYDSSTGEAVRFSSEDGLPSNRVRTVYERTDGTFMVACTGGLALITDDTVTDVYGEGAGISNTEILTAIEAANGDMIVGTDGDGIYVITPRSVLHYGTGSGLESDVVMRIKKDVKRDLYWIVTSNSIAYMTPDHQIVTIHKFPYSNNFDLYENSKGDMWVLSSNGIYVVPTEQLIANGEINPIFYGKDNGLSCISTSNSYSELTPEGDLYLAGTTGISKVNIEIPFESVSDLKMAVPYVRADGEYIYPDASGTIRISSDVKKLTIYSYVYNYSLVNPYVTYRLDGFDSSSATVKRSDMAPVDYTNLKGGSYTFIMQITDPYGNSSKELRVKIVKEKAIFERLWFNLLCLLLILALLAAAVYFYIRRRTNKLLKKEREQRMLVREIVEAFAKVIDMKDKYTNGHSTRVAEYTVMLAKELGCDDETIERYYNIALLHDIGKVGVPPEVLNKPGKLTDTEFNIIKSHSALGFNTLKDISIMPELSIGAGAHHERPDGRGYPKGMKGDEIPRVAQIIAVADTFDAMYSDRPYRKRMNFEKVVSIMKEVRGTQLTEDVVDAFLRLVDKGEFRAPDDTGGGTVEDIDNIHKKFEKQEKNGSSGNSEAKDGGKPAEKAEDK